MFGILYYNLFLVLGFITASYVFKNKDIWYKILAGGVMANVILMFAIVPLACLLGFTVAAHLVLMIVWIFAVFLYICKAKPRLEISCTAQTADKKAFFFGILPVWVIICLLLTNHIMAPTDSGIASGQSTYGDLAMHMGFVSSIAEQKHFPPQYNILSGYRLSYPFLADSLSSSLVLLGTSLRTAILLPSYCMTFLLVLGFYTLSYNFTQKRSASLLALWFFFLNGAFGFAYFLEGAKADSSVFTRIFSGYYKTPTNLNEENIRWSNTICDMIIPQRTTMAGWMALVYALTLLKDAVEKGEKRIYIILGLVAGAMPMIHTHSFLALGIVSAAVFFAFLPKQDNKAEYLKCWIIYGAITLLLAMPQLFYWTFRHTAGNDSFLRLKFNWVNNDDPYLWFWIKNWGIIFIFMIPAFLNAAGSLKRFAIGGLAIFVIAELVLFQQNEYDNNKLFYVAYMLAVILCADYFTIIYKTLKGKIRGFAIAAAVIVFCQTFSGALTVVREYISGGQYTTFTNADIELSEWVKENTSPDDIFLTGTHHLNPVSALSGRTIYVGSSLYVYFHGYVSQYAKRSAEVENIYKSNSADSLLDTAYKTGAKYILLSSYEKKNYSPDISVFDSLLKVYDNGSSAIYKIR